MPGCVGPCAAPPFVVPTDPTASWADPVSLLAMGGVLRGAVAAVSALATYGQSITDSFQAPTVWPPNGGAVDTPAPASLLPGTSISRFGSNDGTYVAPTGTPFGQLSLPSESANLPYNTYIVNQPIVVQASTAAPWFGQVGGATQFQLPMSAQYLIDFGVLMAKH